MRFCTLLHTENWEWMSVYGRTSDSPQWLFHFTSFRLFSFFLKEKFEILVSHIHTCMCIYKYQLYSFSCKYQRQSPPPCYYWDVGAPWSSDGSDRRATHRPRWADIPVEPPVAEQFTSITIIKIHEAQLVSSSSLHWRDVWSRVESVPTGNFLNIGRKSENCC